MDDGRKRQRMSDGKYLDKSLGTDKTMYRKRELEPTPVPMSTSRKIFTRLATTLRRLTEPPILALEVWSREWYRNELSSVGRRQKSIEDLINENFSIPRKISVFGKTMTVSVVHESRYYELTLRIDDTVRILTVFIDTVTGIAELNATYFLKSKYISPYEYFEILDLLCRGTCCGSVHVKDEAFIQLYGVNHDFDTIIKSKYTVPYTLLLFINVGYLFIQRYGYVPLRNEKEFLIRQLNTLYDVKEIPPNIIASVPYLSALSVLHDDDPITLKDILKGLPNNENINKFLPKVKRWFATQLRSLHVPMCIKTYIDTKYIETFDGNDYSGCLHRTDIRSALSSASGEHSSVSASKSGDPAGILKKYRLARRRGDDVNPRDVMLIPSFKYSHVPPRTLDAVHSFKHIIIPTVRDIYLFGDEHTDVPISDDTGHFILDWIVGMVIKEPTRLFDVFIEMIGMSYILNQGPLFGAILKYIPILRKFKNIRIRDIDIRPDAWSVVAFFRPPDILNTVFVLSNAFNFIPHHDTIHEQYMYAVSMLLAILFHVIFGIDLEILRALSFWRDQKQAWDNRLTDQNLVYNMRTQVVDTYFNVNDNIKKIEKQIKNSIFDSDRHNFLLHVYSVILHNSSFVSDVNTMCIYLATMLMDTYCLARIFRRTHRDAAADPLTCFVIAGAAHTGVYSAFMTSYFDGTKVMQDITSVDKRLVLEEEPAVKIIEN